MRSYLAKSIWLGLIVLWSIQSSAYRFEPGDLYVGSGFGAGVTVVRDEEATSKKPGAYMPLLIRLNYVVDSAIGAFLNLVPGFGVGSMNFALQAGGRYSFSFLDAPYVPYISVALVPSFFVPLQNAPSHFNLGISPGVGIDFFLLAKLLVGAHIDLNPSISFAEGRRRFEFSVTSFFDVSLRV